MLNLDSWRPWLYKIHGWIGISLGLILFLISFSGTLAVFSHEIDWLFQPQIHVQDPPDNVHWDALYQSVHDENPKHVIDEMKAPRYPGFPAWVEAVPPGADEKIVYFLHPGTGHILAKNPVWSVQTFFREFHRRFFHASFFTPISADLLVTGFSFVMILSLITGLLFYKKWWRYFLRLRFDRGVQVFFGDLHKVLGLWSYVIVAIILAMGSWYFVEELADQFDYDFEPEPSRSKQSISPSWCQTLRFTVLGVK